MKKLVILALVLVASASSYTATAAKKKVVKQPQVPVVQPVVLTNGHDSVSYAAGMAITDGLIPYLKQQHNVDTAYMADFIKGFKEVINNTTDPKIRAYAAGLQIALQLNDKMLPGMMKEFTDTPDTIVTSLVYRGFTDALQNDSTVFTQAAGSKFFRERSAADQAAKQEKLYGPNRDAGRRFLAENAKKDSVVVLPSGLQYKVLYMGDGEKPKLDDKVLVHYEGRLIDGTVFDASRKHGDKPAEFRPNQVIKGWTEALTMMPVGSKWTLYIPYELAYGERASGQIKPFSALIFDVVLEGIDKPVTEEASAPEAKDANKSKKDKKSKK